MSDYLEKLPGVIKYNGIEYDLRIRRLQNVWCIEYWCTNKNSNKVICTTDCKNIQSGAKSVLKKIRILAENNKEI